MEDKAKFPMGTVTWSEIRSFIYFATILISVVLYINTLSNKLDLQSQQLNTVSANLESHGQKLNTLASDLSTQNDRLTKIETTLEINQQEGKISSATPKRTNLAPEIALNISPAPNAAQSAQPTTPAAQPNSTTTTNNFFENPTPIPTPTQTTEISVPSPTQSPGIVSGILNSLGL